MIRANITEIKNRLSHYLRLVQGGEQIEIIDRKTPLARLVGIVGPDDNTKVASWVERVKDLGIVKPPEKDKARSGFEMQPVTLTRGESAGVLNALLEERDDGR